MVVIDSGVMVAILVEKDEFHNNAVSVLSKWQEKGEEFAAPRLLVSEASAVIRRYVYVGDLTFERGMQTIENLLAFDLLLYHDDDLIRGAYSLANELNTPRSYDTQYLALAERLECDFWTTDRKFHSVSWWRYPRVKLIGGGT